MTLRTDSIYGHSEPFGYDGMNRLTSGGEDSYAYDTRGNVTHRSGVGAYTYSSAAPYAVSEVPFNAMVPQREQRVAYNALQLPDSICEDGAVATFTYGTDLQRSAMRIKKGTQASLSVRYHDGGSYTAFDRLTGDIGLHKDVLWVGGDAYTAPAAMVRDYGSDGWRLLHVVRDCQGSVTAVTDTAGTVLERNSYDPWGVRRDPRTHRAYDPGEEPELLLGRGYCGHEHLPDFGLINMNARLYDPALCRFLSPDPMVQAPGNSQNFNRYTYCLNNPLRYTDPSGMVSYDWKNWEVELDEVVVTPKIPAPILPWGVNRYQPQDPNEWMQYYGLPQGMWGGRGNGDPFDINQGGYTSTSDGLGVTNKISINNTAVSFPVNTTNQLWEYVHDYEGRQIASLQQSLSSAPNAETEKLFQSKAAQYETLEKPYSKLNKFGKVLTITSFITTGVDACSDIKKGHYKSMGARVAVSVATYASNYIPIVGPFVSVSLGLADALWGELFYNLVENEF